jgi:F-type H+-transporting ATPase subunit a
VPSSSRLVRAPARERPKEDQPGMVDPIHQFQITKLLTIAKIGSAEIVLTNSALFMIVAVTAISAFLIVSTRSRALVPGRLQAVSEMLYEFVADMLRDAAGPEAKKFFPLVFTLFSFILVANVMGLIPYGFTVTSHIIITAALALLVFFTVIIAGFWKHGLRFLRVFVPSGIPIYILPLVTAIEVMSFITRPLSHSVRLFANMLAGHITLKVFAGFVTMLGALGVLGIVGAIVPLALTIALTALETLVAVLQAYVFAILTCIYLNDALHAGH